MKLSNQEIENLHTLLKQIKVSIKEFDEFILNVLIYIEVYVAMLLKFGSIGRCVRRKVKIEAVGGDNVVDQ